MLCQRQNRNGSFVSRQKVTPCSRFGLPCSGKRGSRLLLVPNDLVERAECVFYSLEILFNNLLGITRARRIRQQLKKYQETP